jgi:uncharacterized membrane protein
MSDRIEFYVGTYILYGLALLFPGAFLALTVYFAVEADYLLAALCGLITYLLGAVVYTAIFIGYVKTSLLLVDRKDFGISDLRPTFKEMYRVLVAAVLYLVMVGIGLLLFIVPGIILAIMYYPFGWLIIEQGLGPIAALKRSSELTRGIKGGLFKFFFMCSLVLLAGTLSCLIGLIPAFPTVLTATSYVYRRISKPEASPPYTVKEMAPQSV